MFPLFIFYLFAAECHTAENELLTSIKSKTKFLAVTVWLKRQTLQAL